MSNNNGKITSYLFGAPLFSLMCCFFSLVVHQLTEAIVYTWASTGMAVVAPCELYDAHTHQSFEMVSMSGFDYIKMFQNIVTSVCIQQWNCILGCCFFLIFRVFFESTLQLIFHWFIDGHTQQPYDFSFTIIIVQCNMWWFFLRIHCCAYRM